MNVANITKLMRQFNIGTMQKVPKKVSTTTRQLTEAMMI